MKKFLIDEIDEVVADMHTIQDMLRWTVSQFNNAQIFYGHGTDNSWNEAIQLILQILSLPFNFPPDMYNTRLTSRERMRIITLVIRRINERIPVSYLTNKSWFCNLEFYVDTRVFIPRSPIGELITKHFHELLPRSPKYILDMCTGSGCIAIACAYAYPYAEIDAVDIIPNVLEVAEYNIQIHNVENQVTPILSDLFCNLPKLAYDLIIINPPYIKKEDIKNLPAEYHTEPVFSLTTGSNDRLKLIRKVLVYALEYLNEEGILICEVGDSMVHLINQYPQVPFRWLEFTKGGYGVFMLTRHQLFIYKKFLKKMMLKN